MDRRPLITEFRYKADSSDWTDVLAYFCREATDEDRRIATKLNRLREEILIVCEKRKNFADELKSIRGIVVVGKAVEFVTDTLRKDNVQVAQLREVESQMESRAFEKDLFIQKLVGNVEKAKQSLGEDYRIVREINKVALELNNVVTEKDKFLEELDSLGVRPVPAKTKEFMREIHAKDKETVEKLQILLQGFFGNSGCCEPLKRSCLFKNFSVMCLSEIDYWSMLSADEVAKCNYKEFGDIVSFDATFNSNNKSAKNGMVRDMWGVTVVYISCAVDLDVTCPGSLFRCDPFWGCYKINKVALELNNVVTEKDKFLEELDSLGVRPVPAKTEEFMREIQAKDKETVEKLQIL
ncbi:hypothetical protein Tco_0385308 [Tanacetum coccineum]